MAAIYYLGVDLCDEGCFTPLDFVEFNSVKAHSRDKLSLVGTLFMKILNTFVNGCLKRTFVI